MIRKQVAVIGLGYFGLSIADTLLDMGHDILVIDVNNEKIQEVSDRFTHAVCTDTTNEKSLKSLGLQEFDVVVVSIGEDLQANILTTMILKDIGCSYVVVKARNKLHAKVLERIGADRVVSPEHDMGLRIAHSLSTYNVLEFLELSPDFSIVEVTAPPKMINKNLQELRLRDRYGINVIAIKDRNGFINISPGPDDPIREGDVMVMVGDNKVLAKFGWI